MLLTEVLSPVEGNWGASFPLYLLVGALEVSESDVCQLTVGHFLWRKQPFFAFQSYPFVILEFL